jgi:pimeloyl-ACP methyl ester carboxylesterase
MSQCQRIIKTKILVSPIVTVIGAWIFLSSCVLAQQSAPAYEGHAELPGVRIWYKDTGGSGIPVVFLHASTGSMRVWEHQTPAFTKAGYRVIAYDRRGWGRSVVISSGKQPGTAADDLHALLEHLGVDRFHIVATAAGGSIAWDVALSFPERVRSMIVANNSGRVVDEAYRNLASSLRPKQWDELPSEFREVGPVYRATNPEGTRRWIELEHMSRPPGPIMDSQPLRNRLTFLILETVQTPVLIIRGGADLASPAPLSHFFSDRVKTAETLVVPDAGHSVFWEQPEIFNSAVLDFIGKY